MKAFDFRELLSRRAAHGKPSLEFLREKSMSMMVYSLPPGGPDPQHPHGEDEVYVVLEGRAFIRVAGEDREVGPGSVVFVPARAEHHFHAITETLNVLVMFAPPRSGA